MLEELLKVLSFDPVLVGVFAGISMLTVQMLKTVSNWVADHALLVNGLLSIFLAVMVVFEITFVLQIAIIAFLIMTSASGVYSTTKKQEVKINYPEYGD